MGICFLFHIFLLLLLTLITNANLEGDALYASRRAVNDPDNVLQSCDPTLVDRCTWFHVTCDSQNRVTRLDLGNAKLSGKLVPELWTLERLQYLTFSKFFEESFKNNQRLEGPELMGFVRYDAEGCN